MKTALAAGMVLSAAGLPVSGAGEIAPTLSQCISMALKVNPDVRSASARLEAARAAIQEVSSAYYPQLGLSGSWTRTDNPPQAFFMSLNQRRASLQNDFNNPDAIENARGSIVAQWRVYDSGRREADRQVAKMGSQAADYTLDTVRNELVYQVTKAYFSILQARDFVAIQAAAIKSITESLRIAGERNKAGGAMKTDVLNLEVTLSQSHEDLIRARNGVQLAVAVLNTAMGRDWVKMSDVSALSYASESDATATNLQNTVESHPEWRAMEARIKMAEAMTTRARRDYLPVVNAFGSVDWDSEPFSGPERSYIAGAAVEMNLFDGFRNRAGLARATAGWVAAQADADKLKNMLILDLTQSRLNEQEARARMEVTQKSLASAEEALRIIQERYKQGAADISELMTAQVGLTATRSRQVAARYDGFVAKANVARAAGLLGNQYPEDGSQKSE